MPLKIRNIFETELTKSITQTSTELVLDAVPYPVITLEKSGDYFLLELQDDSSNQEIIKCVGINGRILTIGTVFGSPSVNGRGLENTTALTIDHEKSHSVRMVATRGMFEKFVSDISSVDTSYEIAVQAESEAGTDDTKLLSSLQGRYNVDGYFPLATQQQAEDGTDNEARMSPLRGNQALTLLLESYLPGSTVMFFAQDTVPTGWIFNSDDNDKILLNTSTYTEGGDTGGSWTPTGIAVDGHQLSENELPIHSPSLPTILTTPSGRHAFIGGDGLTLDSSATTDPIGGDQEHSHGITNTDWRPAYTKLIACGVPWREWPMGEGVSFGDQYYAIGTNDTPKAACEMIDGTHFVVAYQKSSSYDCEVVMGTVSGEIITFGNQYLFRTASSYISYFSVTLLDSTHFVITYLRNNYGCAQIGIISEDGAITFGDYSYFYAGYHPVSQISCTVLDSAHFIITFHDNYSSSGTYQNGIAKIGTVSGDAIVFGSDYVFSTEGVESTSCATIDTTHFVVSYNDSDNDLGKAIIGTVTGDTITFGSQYTFSAILAMNVKCKLLDSTHFVTTYKSFSGADTLGRAIIGTFSGDIITFGSEYTFTSVDIDHPSCTVLDATHFAAVYLRGSNSFGYTIIGTVSGDTIVFGDESIFRSNDLNYLYYPCVTIDATHFIVVYTEYNSYPMQIKAKIGSPP